MATPKQEYTRNRNWSYFRLIGAIGNLKQLTTAPGMDESERLGINLAIDKLNLVKNNWDTISVREGLIVRPYKCWECGKRSNIEHLYDADGDSINLCAKHYKTYVQLENG